MAPESITPFDAPVTAQQDHHVRRLLTAFFHTEQQVPRLCSTAGNVVGNSVGNGLVGVIEHARSAGLYLADICAARHLKLEDSDAIRLVSSSPFDVLQRELELVQHLAEACASVGDDGLRRFCDGWLRARMAQLAV